MDKNTSSYKEMCSIKNIKAMYYYSSIDSGIYRSDVNKTRRGYINKLYHFMSKLLIYIIL